MKYESIKLLFQQDKYIQIGSVLGMLLFIFCFYQLTTGLLQNMERDNERFKTYYDTQTGKVTVRTEVYSGKTWILNKCNTPAGYCWDPVEPRK